jgi:hypothetical protein
MSQGQTQLQCADRRTNERGASILEVVVSIFLLAAAGVVLGAGSTLWQIGTRWSTDRYGALATMHNEMGSWPPEPLNICGGAESENWWQQISTGGTLDWGTPVAWTAGHGWAEIPTDDCTWIEEGQIRLIKIATDFLETVVAVERTMEEQP